jgi:hypothetical protein
MKTNNLRRRRVHVLIPVLALASVLAFTVVGCGGGSSESSKANEAYATSVCTAIGSWEQQVKSIASDVSGGLSQASIEAKAAQIGTATKNLATQIKAVPPPKTSEGQAAKQQLDQLSNDATATVNAVKSGIDQIKADASIATITAVVATLTPQLQSLASTAKSAVSSLQGAKGSLSDAFKSTDACTSLG